MTRQSFDINKIRVAAPCTVSWDSMTGDERRRFCGLCELNVYNFSAMTADEVKDLIARSEGRVCGRLYWRADGTVLTKDCPVGLRAVRKRITRLAGAALATILGLFSVSYGQKTDEHTVDASTLKTIRTVSEKNIISGTVTDANGAVIPDAQITLYQGEIQIVATRSDEEGSFCFLTLTAGNFSLRINAPGFYEQLVKNIEVKPDEIIRMEIEIKLDAEFLMGVTATSIEEIPVTEEKIQSLPINNRFLETLPPPQKKP